MKKIFVLFICLIAGGLLFAQSINNVTVKTVVKGGQFDGLLTWYVMGDKIAFDMEFTHEGNTYSTRFIPDKAKGIFHLLSNTLGQKIYSTAEVNTIQPAPGFDPVILSVELAGDEVVSGINCKKIIVKTAGMTTECYIDPTINVNYTSYEAFFRSDYALLAMKELKMNGFPIAFKTINAEGKVVTEVNTVSIQQNSVTENVFKIGSEYKSIEELNKDTEKTNEKKK